MSANMTNNMTPSLKALCIKQIQATRHMTANMTANMTKAEDNMTESMSKTHVVMLEDDKAIDRNRQLFNGELDREFYPAGSEWII